MIVIVTLFLLVVSVAGAPRGQALTAWLTKMTQDLEKLEIPYILHAGTLLQLYRDGAIANDAGDVDLAIPLAELTEERVSILGAFGWRVMRRFGKPGQPGWEVRMHPVVKGRVLLSVGIDLFSMEPVDDDDVNVFLVVSRKLHNCGPLPYLPTQPFEVANATFTIPRDPEAYLERLYGPGWLRPIMTKQWNWVNPACRLDPRFPPIDPSDIILKS